MNNRYEGSIQQNQFINSGAPFPAFVGGFGSGKTDCHIVRLIDKKLRNPHLNVAFYMPTYDLISLIGIPRFEQTLDRYGIKYKTNLSKKVITVRKGRYKGHIIFRTLDKPERIIGYEVADSGVDELDTLKTEKARECWERIIARNRQRKRHGEVNTVSVSTTPEGFRFVYQQWGRKPSESYEIIKAPTASNARNLPNDYIDKLRESYPSQLLEAYIDGEFVNLTAGVVYTEYDRTLNHTNEVIKPDERLHVGMDFNVNNMSAVFHGYRDNHPNALAELSGIRDTPAMISAIRERYNNAITVYPDASGRSTKSVNASVSDIALLIQAGFDVSAPKSNPRVRDRVVSMNAMFRNAKGERRYFVNTDKCPEYTLALEQQAYDKNGEPDKTGGKDHLPDAAGYFISRRHPAKGEPKVTIA